MKGNNGHAGNDKEHTNNGLHLGQLKNGKENPGQGRDRRSETANLHAQDLVKNPTLTGEMPGQGSGNGSAKRVIDPDAPVLITGGDASVEINGDTSGGETVVGVTETGTPTVNGQSEFIWYYHPDHLGSTGFVTDQNGELYEHVEYFPFGETWVQEKSNTQRTPYLYTGKELDEETGLYYYGARYYDPRTGVWASADPILGDYLGNNEAKLKNRGVFDSINLGLYGYGANNPLVFLDPDGNANLRFAENIPPEVRKIVAANLKAVEDRIAKQSTGPARERFMKAFEKWDVKYVGGGKSPDTNLAGKTKGREARSEIWASDQDTLAHEFYHTIPENINRDTNAGLIGRPQDDPSEVGEYGADNFAKDLLSGRNVDRYSKGEKARPLPVQQPRPSLLDLLKGTFSLGND